MKFGVNAWVWTSPLTTAFLSDLAPKVAEMGFDLLEVPIETMTDLDPRHAAEILRDNGLEVSVCALIGPDRDLLSPDLSIRERGVAYVRHCIEAAQVLGAPHVVGPLYSAVGRTWRMDEQERARTLDLLVHELRGLAEFAGERGVTLGIEPLSRFSTSLINLAAQAVEVVDRVAHPACGIMLDTFHMNIEEKHLGDAIRVAGSRLVHLHACENDRGTPGSGHLPWLDVAAALNEIGYDGPVVLESFSPDVERIARAAAVWRPVAVSQDALAAQGLAFLRQLFTLNSP